MSNPCPACTAAVKLARAVGDQQNPVWQANPQELRSEVIRSLIRYETSQHSAECQNQERP